MPKPRVKLAQLPVPPPAYYAATGNEPLAAGCLAVSAAAKGFSKHFDLEVVAPEIADSYGDAALADYLARDEPAVVGLSLYLWNSERSLHIARELKRRSPNTLVVIGGPEVEADNIYILEQEGFDLAVSGEAEEVFSEILSGVVRGEVSGNIPGIALRASGSPARFSRSARAELPLSQFPSPYLANVLKISPERSVLLETARGCRSRCSFCFYSHRSPAVRTLEIEEIARRVEKLKAGGAREIFILDPMFNQRSDFTSVLEALAAINRDRALTFFAEIRAEKLTARQMDLLARAGFTRLEIGLQSVNRSTLKRAKRGGDPRKVAEAAVRLKERGIAPIVDLIVGLPGDTLEDVLGGVDFLQTFGLREEVQLMPLSVLPGTTLRESAAVEGIAYEIAPPYRVIRTDTMGEGAVAEAILAAEERLERRVDEYPRPHLVSPEDAIEPADVFVIEVNRPQEALRRVSRPGARHCALWIKGADLFGRREIIGRAIEKRLEVDPYATLDVVLAGAEAFPLDLVDFVRAALDRGPSWYLTRVLAHRGENAARRISCVLPRRARLSGDYLGFLMDLIPVYQDMDVERALQRAEELFDGLPGARILDQHSKVEEGSLKKLAERADPEAVVFASRRLEAWWTTEVLRYRDAPL